MNPGSGRPLLDRFRLDGRVAVITGASSGLGAACALSFAAGGADLVLGARRAERLDATAEAARAIQCRALTVPTDVTSPTDCERLVAGGLHEFGRVDILVNGAGVTSAVPALREEPGELGRVVDVNLIGSYWMAQAQRALAGRCAEAIEVAAAILFLASDAASYITGCSLPVDGGMRVT